MDMNQTVTLKNEDLRLKIRLPGAEPESQRFDSAAVVSQVMLHGKHIFCEPEQLLPERVTCYGFGLCAEFVMNDIGKKAKKGEWLPKPGVGLARQLEDGLPFDKWRTYEMKRFPKTWEAEEDRITFLEEPISCMGIALRVRRELWLEGKALIHRTTVENVGTERVTLAEYQHNFVSIDHMPVGEGYCLELPFDGTVQDVVHRFSTLSDGTPADSCVRVEGQKIIWTRDMTDRTWQKITEAEDILDCGSYGWTLSHQHSPARISEACDFRPSKLVLWGIEHCICAEVYHKIDLQPGEADTYTRKWIFED